VVVVVRVRGRRAWVVFGSEGGGPGVVSAIMADEGVGVVVVIEGEGAEG
jgi:hypothetical protein